MRLLLHLDHQRVALIALPTSSSRSPSTRSRTALIVAVVLGLINTLIRPLLDPAHAAGDDPYARPVHLRDQRPAVLGGRHVHGGAGFHVADSGRACSARSSTA
jgi:hypothetical protein